ncbi:DEAD/DEAH box helicase [Pedobacter sp. JY14-1]|uniref:DEAD/DEAH box helicase n=1 Tax=Pedobacter sp. JY14-1 TaxID=3034151 RepID=UPI0023E1313E|nr:DEAD/DEAH box helicase [Pedobacter sp. JY14-1]
MKKEQILEKLGIGMLNDMQLETGRAVGTGRDVVLLSPTGSGKTLAFLLPVLQRLDPGYKNIQVLVLVPSRELALQTEQVFRKAGSGFKVSCFYGGHPVSTELKSLSDPPVVLIGTPGRIAFHLEAGNLDESGIRILVLDEFDKCLELGFQDDLDYIIAQLRTLGQRILISATGMDEIPGFTGIRDPELVNFLDWKAAVPKLLLKRVDAAEVGREAALLDLMAKTGGAAALVFCNERATAGMISRLLVQKGFSAELYHGGMEQDERERALLKFRNGTANILVTTDLASRGLDIPEVALIVHYQLPLTAAAFTHRNGRTARMKAEGTVYMLSEQDEDSAFLGEGAVTEELSGTFEDPVRSTWETLYIGAGRKDKVGKTDVAGMLLKKGGLTPAEVGLITIMDRCAYVAVAREKCEAVIRLLTGQKIKNKKVKIEIAK